MIYRSQNLVLPVDTDANAPLLCIDNVVPDVTITATNHDSDHQKTNLQNPTTYLKWKSTDALTANIAISDIVTDTDYCGIAKHNLGTAGCTLKVQGDTGGGYADLSDNIQLVNDDPVLFNFDKDSYIKVRIVIGGGSVAQEIAVMNVGAAVYAQRNIYVGHRPITLVPQLNVVNGRSESGDFLGRITLSERRSTQIELTELTAGWVRSTLDPFFVDAKSLPFFFGWRPSTYPLEVGYVWMDGDPDVSNSRSNGFMDASFSVAGVA